MLWSLLFAGAALWANPLTPGGSLSSADLSRNAFSHPSSNLSLEARNEFFVGNSFFKQAWVQAPSSTVGRDGLGPTFNSVSCAGCHVLDGRGHAYLKENLGISLLFRVRTFLNDKWIDHPSYGGQLNPLSVSGVPSEVRIRHRFDSKAEVYRDGTVKELKSPRFQIEHLGFGPIGADTIVSPRIGAQVIGMGLIEAIAVADLLVREDPFDKDQDGISGRASWVLNKSDGSQRLGRFGWKAEQPTVRQQVAAAFLGDMGITSTLFPSENCPGPQVDCQQATTGGHPEIDDSTLDRVVHYTRHLAVPSARHLGVDEYLEGLELFRRVGCADCHTPSYVTDPLNPEFGAQLIYPFSDFLLHDMGDDLSDLRVNSSTLETEPAPAEDPIAREWRTPPLWGIGLLLTVNRHQQLLHDGRANGVEEAILWHGGEADRSRQNFRKLFSQDRERLIRFVESL